MSDEKFAEWIESQLVSEGGYVIDTGSKFLVHEVIKERLEKKIQKHPLIWKWFFMIA